MKASVIILNWNGGSAICLEAVGSAIAQDYPKKEIIFVDNNSTDGSFESVQASYPGLMYVQTGKNLGCPGGRNAGAAKASGEILFFLENDGLWATKDVVSSIMSLFAKQKNLGALYTRVEGYESCRTDPPIDRNVDNTVTDGLYLSSSFRGGASAIRRDLFNRVGQFPSDFVRQYEERYVSLLIYNLGFKVAYFPAKILRHRGSDYPGKSSTVFAFNCINELKTIARIYPKHVWILYFVVKCSLWLFRTLQSGNPYKVLRCSWGFPSSPSPSERIAYSTLKEINLIRYAQFPIAVPDTPGQS